MRIGGDTRRRVQDNTPDGEGHNWIEDHNGDPEAATRRRNREGDGVTTHISKIDVTQELSSRAGMAVARGTDDRICQRLNEILGEWSPEGLRGRLVIQTTPDKVETYLLDGHPFMKADPPTFDMTRSIISTTRRFWSICHPLELAA